MEKVVIFCLRVALILGYLWVLNVVVWNLLPITTSIGVLVGSLTFFIVSLILSIITSNKIVDIIRR